jgi:ATP-dependent RNA helicase DDX5/DBP2
VFPTFKEIRYNPTYTNIYQQAPFSPEILNAIRSAGFSTPSPIQAQCWPYLAAKHDLVAVAKTGSGKVFFFIERSS